MKTKDIIGGVSPLKQRQPSRGGKPTVIALLGGVTALLGTLALLGSKRR